MKENETIVSGYSFIDAAESKNAKKEAESIEYIRANTDLNDLNKVLKLYHKLTENQAFQTIIGYEFLKELQLKLIANNVVTMENLPSIPVMNGKQPNSAKEFAQLSAEQRENKLKDRAEEYRIKHRNSRIINIFLVTIIAAMIIIALLNDSHITGDYEEKILNKYSSWEEELEAKEKDLKEKESILYNKEKELDTKKANMGD